MTAAAGKDPAPAVTKERGPCLHRFPFGVAAFGLILAVAFVGSYTAWRFREERPGSVVVATRNISSYSLVLEADVEAKEMDSPDGAVMKTEDVIGHVTGETLAKGSPIARSQLLDLTSQPPPDFVVMVIRKQPGLRIRTGDTVILYGVPKEPTTSELLSRTATVLAVESGHVVVSVSPSEASIVASYLHADRAVVIVRYLSGEP